MTGVIIGIHVYAEPEGLHASLKSLRAYTPSTTRIVLLPDGPDSAGLVALGQMQDFPQLGAELAQGAPVCFNRLISYDQAEVFIFLESGSRVTAGWLERLLAALQADPAHGLAGPSTNRSWNEQRLAGAPAPTALTQSVDAFAAEVARRYDSYYRILEPLYSLADFCYVVKQEVIAVIGGADEGYGIGPCWEMDYNIRAARAGFKGVWACGAYVHRLPPAAIRVRNESRFLPPASSATRISSARYICAASAPIMKLAVEARNASISLLPH